MKVDFTIISVPDRIALECPHCHDDIEIDWDDIDVPDSWQDDWGNVTCPTCGHEIELGDWEYD